MNPITKELNNMRDGGFTVRHMAFILDVTEATVHNWMGGIYEPKASQMDMLRAFYGDEIKKAG